eukprot:EG_transcript_16933
MATLPALRRVAVVQLCSTAHKAANLDTCERLLKEGAAQGAQLVCFPEAFDFLANSAEERLALAEPIRGPEAHLVNRFRQLARAHRVWLSLGGMKEVADGKRVYNTHLIVNDAGELASVYRKVHLFDVDVEGLRYFESESTAPGDEYVVCDTPAGRLGVTTCYDLRFPEHYCTLAREGGAEVLLVPSAFTVPTGQAHWEVLLRARAVEHQCFVVAAAQVGFNTPKRQTYGHSLVVDPWGSVLCDMAEDVDAVRVISLDFDRLRSVRARMPCRSHVVPLKWPAGAPPPPPAVLEAALAEERKPAEVLPE